MTSEQHENSVEIDGYTYKLDELSESAKEQLASIQFVDAQIQQLRNEWAVADTARIGYANALRQEAKKID